MPIMSPSSPKAKITLTLSPELLRQVDALLRTEGNGSRSQVVETALRHWLQERAHLELERQTEAYYWSLSKGGQKEDRQWAQIGARSSRRLWD